MPISDSTIDAINQLAPADLSNHGIIRLVHSKSDEYICPVCGNGEGHDATGIKPNITASHIGWKCQRCGEKFNNLKIIAAAYGLDAQRDFIQLVEKTCEQFNIPINYDGKDINWKKPSTPPAKETNPDILKFIHEDLAANKDALIQFVTDNGGQWRGLPADLLLKFGCRYIPNWKHPKSRAKQIFANPTPRIIIPSNADSYLARLTCSLDDFDDNTRKYIKPKQHAGEKTLFNPDALHAKDPVFAVESYIDAMSLELVGFKAVATGGAKDYKLIVDAVKPLKKKPFVIILFDPDDTGRDNAPKLQADLYNVGCRSVIKFLTNDNCKLDPNEILTEQGDYYLMNELFAISQEAQKEPPQEPPKIESRTEREKNQNKPAPMTDTQEDFNGKDYMKGLTEDLDNARRLTKFCGDRVKWLTDSERWLIWNKKGVWMRCSEKNSCLASEVTKFADLMMYHAIQLAAEAEKLSQEFLKIATAPDGHDDPKIKAAQEKANRADSKKDKAFTIAYSFRKVTKVSAAITMMKGVEEILITEEDLDRHPNLINTLNGVIDLETKTLYPAEPSLLLTQQCRAAYISDAQSDTVDNFFKAIQPDEMTRAGLLRWLGYCLTGDVQEEKFMVWTGGGGNGKGVTSATVLELLGTYGIGLAPTSLLKSNKPIDADKASTALNGIELARFAISEEMPADGELDTSLIKNLTGGDRINLRKLYSEYRTVRPTAKINISGNYIPKIENVHDGGLLRRMLNMPFLVQFGTPTNPADPNLKKKLLLPDNLNAFLRLLVDEAANWYRDSLIISPQMAQETKRHLAQNDFITDFIDDNENYERGDNLSVKAKDFIDALKKEYPRECGRFKRNDLIKLIAETDGITYCEDRHRFKIFKGIGKKGTPTQQSFDDFNGEPISDDDLPI